MDESEVLLELWKKTVDVQQHFNDIELRIRNIAITLFASVLGVAAVAFREHRPMVACLICGAGLIALAAFFLMDYLWYHQLLIGAVQYGTQLESRIAVLGLQEGLPAEGLTGAISRTSAYELPAWLPMVGKKKLRSSTKMKIFYGLLALTMAVGGAISGYAALTHREDRPEPAQQIRATIMVGDTVYVALPKAVHRKPPKR